MMPKIQKRTWYKFSFNFYDHDKYAGTQSKIPSAQLRLSLFSPTAGNMLGKSIFLFNHFLVCAGRGLFVVDGHH